MSDHRWRRMGSRNQLSRAILFIPSLRVCYILFVCSVCSRFALDKGMQIFALTRRCVVCLQRHRFDRPGVLIFKECARSGRIRMLRERLGHAHERL